MRGLDAWIEGDGAALTLAYVDDADITEAGFERFLRRYAPLCRRLGSAVEVAFVTATHGQEPLAEHAFARVMHRRDMRSEIARLVDFCGK